MGIYNPQDRRALKALPLFSPPKTIYLEYAYGGPESFRKPLSESIRLCSLTKGIKCKEVSTAKCVSQVSGYLHL